jgi:hypothetical protein
MREVTTKDADSVRARLAKIIGRLIATGLALLPPGTEEN